MREYFLCTKKIKTTSFNNLSPLRHPGAILESITYVNNVCCSVSCAMPKWCQGDVEETNCRIVVFFIFYFFIFLAYKKSSHSFVKLRLNNWCHMDYFTDVLVKFLDLDCCNYIAVYGGSESSQNSWKISCFVFRRWTKVLRFWKDMRVSN